MHLKQNTVNHLLIKTAVTALFKGLRTVSFFDFGTFFLFAEESDELPVPKSRLLWDGVVVV